MSFRTAKGRPKINKVGGLGRPTGAIPLILGRVGGQGGGHRRLLESDRNWQESDNAFRTPCTPKGGGGFKGLRPTRQPFEILSIHIFIILSFIYPAANVPLWALDALMDGVHKMIYTSCWVAFGTLRDNAIWLTSNLVSLIFCCFLFKYQK